MRQAAHSSRNASEGKLLSEGLYKNNSQRVLMRYGLLSMCLLIGGCHLQTIQAPVASKSQPAVEATSAQLRGIVVKGSLSGPHTEGFDDCQDDVRKVYEATNYAPAWLHDDHPTPQALAIVSALENSSQKGLNPEDYDASLWPARLAALNSASTAGGDTLAQFDASLTVSLLRYLSNLRVGRLNPKPVSFAIDVDQQHYDLAQFVGKKILAAGNLPDVLRSVEPQYLGYKRTLDALQSYQALVAQDHSSAIPDVARSVKIGDAYTATEQLSQKLVLLGDLQASVNPAMPSKVYEGALADAVKRFQGRNGIKADGVLNQATLVQLNTPLSNRVLQLEDSLERWRWLPSDYPLLPVAVNIPGFILRVFSDDHHIALRMNIVVGKAFQHQTPVFANEMKYIIFRPYWNLPLDITRAEIVPKLQKNPRYLARKGFEVTDQGGHVLAGAVTAGILARIRSGGLMVRQKPGALQCAWLGEVHVSQ